MVAGVLALVEAEAELVACSLAQALRSRLKSTRSRLETVEPVVSVSRTGPAAVIPSSRRTQPQEVAVGVSTHRRLASMGDPEGGAEGLEIARNGLVGQVSVAKEAPEDTTTPL